MFVAYDRFLCFGQKRGYGSKFESLLLKTKNEKKTFSAIYFDNLLCFPRS